MPGLWTKGDQAPEGKYLVLRRDGTIPEWPHFVLGGADPGAPPALRAYARRHYQLATDPEFVRDVAQLADDFIAYAAQAPRKSDPEAPTHRSDHPDIIRAMRSHGDKVAHLSLESDQTIQGLRAFTARVKEVGLEQAAKELGID